MKAISKTITLALAVALGIYAWTQWKAPAQKSARDTTQSSLLLPDLEAKNISEVKVTTRFSTLTFQKSGSAWLIKEKENYPASTLGISNFFEQLSSLRAVSSGKLTAPQSWDEFGLLNPTSSSASRTGVLVKILSTTGQVHEVILGDVLDSSSEASLHFGIDFDGHRYARIPGQSSVALVDDTLSRVNTMTNLWIDNRSFKEHSLSKISYFKTPDTQWVLTRKNENQPLTVEIDGQTRELPRLTSSINSMIKTIWFDDLLPSHTEKEQKKTADHYMDFHTTTGASYRIHIGPMRKIPEEEAIYLGRSRGMMQPIVIDRRREITLEEQPGKTAVSSLKRASGVPHFGKTYLINQPFLSKLLINQKELLLFERMLRTDVE